MKKVTGEAEAQAEAEGGIVSRSPELVDNKTPSVATSAEEKICKNNTPDLNEEELVIAAATPSSFVSTAVSGKMLTPKRSRFMVKPTTLFECDTETESVIETDFLVSGEVSKKQDVQNLRELETNSTETKRYGTEFNVNEEKRQKEDDESTDITVADMTEEKISSHSENVESEIVHQSEQPDVSSAVVNVEVTYEMLDVDLHTGEQLKQENQKICAEVAPTYQEPEHKNQEIAVELFKEELMGKNQDMPANDVHTVERLKLENQKMVLEDLPAMDDLKQVADREISVKDMRNTEERERGNPEMLAEDASTTEELKYEDQEEAIENSAPEEDNIYPYLKEVNDLLTLHSQKELTELPLNILLLCQEQLMTILSNTTTAIRLKCEPTRK